jgi:ABC-type transporter MlaC component
MKRLISAMAAVVIIGAMAIAATQEPGHHGNAGDIHAVMFKGLTDEQKAVAQQIHTSLSETAREAFSKRVHLCAKDDHQSLKGKKHDAKSVMTHWQSGLTPEEAKAFTTEFEKLSKEEKAVFTKILKNCCAYGVSKAKG